MKRVIELVNRELNQFRYVNGHLIYNEYSKINGPEIEVTQLVLEHEECSMEELETLCSDYLFERTCENCGEVETTDNDEPIPLQADWAHGKELVSRYCWQCAVDSGTLDEYEGNTMETLGLYQRDFI